MARKLPRWNKTIFRDELVARELRHWHEDRGPMLWWKFPITEAPYCGSPLDTE